MMFSSSVMVSREIPYCHFINHETVSLLIICFCSSVSYFFSVFSSFFRSSSSLPFFSCIMTKYFSFLFIYFCSLFSFFLVFRTRHSVVGKDLVRDEHSAQLRLTKKKTFCLRWLNTVLAVCEYMSFAKL